MTILWQPDETQLESTNIYRFMAAASERFSLKLASFSELHRWSTDQPEQFWDLVWDTAPVIASQKGDRVLVDKGDMPAAVFYPDAKLNFAENLLRRRGDTEALVFRGENGFEQRLTHDDLFERVAQLANAMRQSGIEPGDRVAAMLPNIPDTIIAMLACAATGAVFSSCSPDFGVKGVLDRFQQIEPKIFIAVDGYFYNGKQIDILDKVREISEQLPSVEQTLISTFMRFQTGQTFTLGGIVNARLLEDFCKDGAADQLEFAQLPFSHPLYIMFSSGTTGLPKCIVHRAGGTLLQHLKEHQLHFDVRPDDRLFWYTTCGWMMWNWLASGLASNATLLLFDGNPFYPDGNVLFDFAADTGMTQMGVSAKYIQALEKTGIAPMQTHDLSRLRIIGSTGSTLLPEGFDYVYDKVKKDVCLCSASGGTDIISCFVGGNPMGPVYRGEIQAKGLGMAVEVWNDEGKAVVGEKGELVCTRPFPSMPLGFWNDADNSRYHETYFATYAGVWTQGDYAEETEHGGILIYGRSDATLNPGGVRIGTAEIYRQVEQFHEVLESVVIGQEWEGDVRVVLFVVMRDDETLTPGLVDRLKKQIRNGASPRHVPAKIIPVAEIPRTRSGKITELAIRDTVHGHAVKNIEAIANPGALQHFADCRELLD